jgi:hypothetical protein
VLALIDLIRSSYVDIAKGYRELAENRKLRLQELATALVQANKNADPDDAAERAELI